MSGHELRDRLGLQLARAADHVGAGDPHFPVERQLPAVDPAQQLDQDPQLDHAGRLRPERAVDRDLLVAVPAGEVAHRDAGPVVGRGGHDLGELPGQRGQPTTGGGVGGRLRVGDHLADQPVGLLTWADHLDKAPGAADQRRPVGVGLARGGDPAARRAAGDPHPRVGDPAGVTVAGPVADGAGGRVDREDPAGEGQPRRSAGRPPHRPPRRRRPDAVHRGRPRRAEQREQRGGPDRRPSPPFRWYANSPLP